MTLTEAYSFLFADSFMGALVVPPYKEMVFGTMISFGGYDIGLTVLLAALGSTLAMLVNYGFGRLILLCEKQEIIPIHSRHMEDAADSFRRYGIWLLPFVFIPVFGTAFTVAAGLSRTKLPIFLPLVLIGRLGYYGVLAWL